MGIKFRCQDCDKKLHVKSFLAGKRGICPHCGARVQIPEESAPAEEPVAAAAEHAARPPARRKAAPDRKPSAKPAAAKKTSASAHNGSTAAITKKPAPPSTNNKPPGTRADDPLAAAPDAVWYVRPPGGGQFGPATADIMRRWLDEGRVSSDSLVWREGWPDWKAAGPVFPSLDNMPVEPAATGDFLPESTTTERHAAAFPVTPDGKLGVSTRLKNRSRQGGHGRNVAVIVVLSVACVALLIALFFVLTSQS